MVDESTGRLDSGGEIRLNDEGISIDPGVFNDKPSTKAKACTPAYLLSGVAGGFLGAGISAIVWYVIAIVTGYEAGLVAILVGLCCGYGVLYGARGCRGMQFQGIAVVFSVAGIMLGKYLSFSYFAIQAATEEYGAAATEGVSFLSPQVAELFIEVLPELLGVFDILWVVIAIGAAWKVPSHLEGSI